RAADADDEDALADRVDVDEVDRLEPLDADEDLIAVVAAGDVELFAFRRAGADKHRVVLVTVDERPEALDRRVVADLDPHVDDVGDFLVEDLDRQPEGG